MYPALADGVVLLHFGWILFLIVGGYWGRKWRTARVLHIGGLSFALILQVLDWYCPLTHLEAWLRWMDAQGPVLDRSFVIYYVEKFVYLDVPRSAVFLATIVLCGFNAWLYLRRK